MARDRPATVIVTIGNHGPAVIETGLDEIELVTATRPHLMLPELSIGTKGQPVWISMAGRPGQRPHTIRIRMRIILRHGTIEIHAENFSHWGRIVLCGCRQHAVTDGKEQMLAVRRESNNAARLSTAGRRILFPDRGLVFQRCLAVTFIQHSARQNDAAAILRRFVIGKIDCLALLKIRCGRNIKKTVLAAKGHFRHASDSSFVTRLRDDENLAALLRQ